MPGSCTVQTGRAARVGLTPELDWLCWLIAAPLPALGCSCCSDPSGWKEANASFTKALAEGGACSLPFALPSLNGFFPALPPQCDTLFQDLGKLKSRPAHLGVFLRYIFSQADPSPLVRAKQALVSYCNCLSVGWGCGDPGFAAGAEASCSTGGGY